MNTKLLAAGCVAAMSVALVSGQSGQTARQPNSSSNPVVTPVRAGSSAQALNNKSQSSPAAPDVAKQRALIDQYCVGCHNSRAKTAKLMLDQLDLANLGAHAEIGEKVVRKLRAGMMPPTTRPRPDPATMESLIRWMEGELDRSAVTNLPPPGLHRLNRTEYANAIRDLLDRKSTRLNSSHSGESRMPSSA